MQEEHHVAGPEAELAVAADPERKLELGTDRKHGIILIPKPSDEPKDPLVSRKDHYDGRTSETTATKVQVSLTDSSVSRPLQNWAPKKKYTTLFVLCFAAFAGAATPTAHQTGYVVISHTYHKTPTELSYSISAAVAGLFVGPLILLPFTRVIGRTSLIFWSLSGAIATQLWAAKMTGRDDYDSFLISRLFAGLFGSVATILGSGYIMDMFFLHQRGK